MLTSEAQARAARFTAAEVRQRLFNPMVRPRWIRWSDRFWYPHERADRIAHVAVDAAIGSRARSFDHAALSAALQDSTPKDVAAG